VGLGGWLNLGWAMWWATVPKRLLTIDRRIQPTTTGANDGQGRLRGGQSPLATEGFWLQNLGPGRDRSGTTCRWS